MLVLRYGCDFYSLMASYWAWFYFAEKNFMVPVVRRWLCSFGANRFSVVHVVWLPAETAASILALVVGLKLVKADSWHEA